MLFLGETVSANAKVDKRKDLSEIKTIKIVNKKKFCIQIHGIP